MCAASEGAAEAVAALLERAPAGVGPEGLLAHTSVDGLTAAALAETTTRGDRAATRRLLRDAAVVGARAPVEG
jgi:hypothetical protein